MCCYKDCKDRNTYCHTTCTKYKDYLDRYERIYRPLELTSTYTDSYDYYKNPWPWDNDGGIKYV